MSTSSTNYLQSVTCNKCGLPAEEYMPGDNTPQRIFLCVAGCGPAARFNVICDDCKVPTISGKYSILCDGVEFSCPLCKKIVHQYTINHSDRAKTIAQNVKNVPKSEIPCRWRKGCRSVGKGECPYAH